MDYQDLKNLVEADILNSCTTQAFLFQSEMDTIFGDGKGDNPSEVQPSLFTDGTDRIGSRITIDSVQSRANRIEEALKALYETREDFPLPVLSLQFSADDHDHLEDLREEMIKKHDVEFERIEEMFNRGVYDVTIFDLPHRSGSSYLENTIYDDEEFYNGRTPNMDHPVAAALQHASGKQNFLPLLRISPTSILFGTWNHILDNDRTSSIPRSFKARIWGKVADVEDPGNAPSAQQTDPWPGERPDQVPIREGTRMVDPEADEKKGKSNAGMGENPKAGSDEADIKRILVDSIRQSAQVSLGSIRKRGFNNEDPSEDIYYQTVLASLGLLTLAGLRQGAGESNFLRSECNLENTDTTPIRAVIQTPSGTEEEVLFEDGSAFEQSLHLYRESVEKAREKTGGPAPNEQGTVIGQNVGQDDLFFSDGEIDLRPTNDFIEYYLLDSRL